MTLKYIISKIFHFQRMAVETRSKGGILIPEKARAKGMEATVVAVGPGYRDGFVFVV